MKPKVIVYAATSLDGCTTGFPVDLGLFYSLVQQWGEDATLVGSSTIVEALKDVPLEPNVACEPEPSAIGEPEPTAIGSPETPPVGGADQRALLVVPDSRGRIRNWEYLRHQPYWRGCLALTTKSTPREYMALLNAQGVEWMMSGVDRVDFKQALEQLNERFGITVVRVDSGGTLNGVLLRGGLVDELHLLVHPVLVGAGDHRRFFDDPGADVTRAYNGPIGLRLTEHRVLEQDVVMLSYAVVGADT
jgi:2,5-diamino-6-(ribosylamino)-4(3H)-pyrimidinone 5'-phosphate reductase